MIFASLSVRGAIEMSLPGGQLALVNLGMNARDAMRCGPVLSARNSPMRNGPADRLDIEPGDCVETTVTGKAPA